MAGISGSIVFCILNVSFMYNWCCSVFRVYHEVLSVLSVLSEISAPTLSFKNVTHLCL